MASRPNVILLIFDTLRSDYLSCYNSSIETPSFGAAADDGIVFESAFSVAPGTPISHASLYTGLYPGEHGVTGQYLSLPESVPVVAEWLQDVGYDTFGIAGPSKMGSEWGFDRGFEELFEPYYDLPDHTSWRNISKSIVDGRFRRYFIRQITKGGHERTRFKFQLLEETIESELDRPFFALCNFTTVHAPYDPPRPYKTQTTPTYSRPYWFLLEFLLDDHGTVSNPNIRLDRVMNIQTADGVGRYLADPQYLNDDEVELLRSWYAATVRYLDDELRTFLDYYRRELRDDTILVLTADHGEQLGEHGLWEHSHYFYDETLKIPLIIIGPDIPPGGRRTDLVSNVDIFDTLCDMCSLDSPESTSGISLFSDRERDAVFMEYGERDVEDFAETSGHGRYLDDAQLRQFCAGRKAIRTHSYRFEITSRGTEHLYSLPEQCIVPLAESDETDQLRNRLLDTLGEEFGICPEGDPDELEITTQVKDNLRRLGYID